MRTINDLSDRMAAADTAEAAKTIPIEVYQDFFATLSTATKATLLDAASKLLYNRITECVDVLGVEAPDRVHEKAFNDQTRFMQQLRKARVWCNWYMTL